MLPAPWAADRSSSSPTPACSAGPSACCSTAPRGSARPACSRARRGRWPPRPASAGLAGRPDPQPLAADARRARRRRRAGSAGSRSTPRGWRAATGPAALVAWGARAVLAAAAAPRAGAPLLAVHHDLLPSAGVAAAVRAATLRADGAVATSEAVARDLRRGGVTILHPGVDLAAWPPCRAAGGPAARARARRAGRRGSAPTSRSRSPRACRSCELELAGAPLPGDGDGFVAALRERAAAADLAGRVTFAGALADPRPALARAHVLLHCADAEPFGMVLLEALASRAAGRRARRRRPARDRRGRRRPAVPARRRRRGARRRARAARRPGAPGRRAGPRRALRRRGLRRPLRRRRRGGRPVSPFTSSSSCTTPGPSWPRCCRRSRATPRAPQLVVVDTGSRDGGAALARAHGAEVVELPGQPRLRRRQQRRRSPAHATTSPSCSTRTASWSTTRCMRSRRWRESTRVRCTPRGCSSRTAACSAPPTRCPAPSARCCPRSCTRRCCRARCASAPSRIAPSGPHRRLGDRRVPRRRHRRCCASSARSTPPCTCSRRTWSSGCAPAPRGIPTVLHPHAARPPHGRALDPPRRRAVRAARAPPPRGGRVGARTARPRARRPRAAAHLRHPHRRPRRAAAATRPASGRNWPLCAGKSGASRKGGDIDEA